MTYTSSTGEIDDSPSNVFLIASSSSRNSIKQRAKHVTGFANRIHLARNDYHLDQLDDSSWSSKHETYIQG
jgi:predicted AAA+ superfamily ATPase